jgi:hypothetical protein
LQKYDVALSFAGEDRPYVEEVARHLREAGIKVFYDEFEKVGLWGRNLYQHLQEIYRDQARYSIVFISKHYDGKKWTAHELESMQVRAFRENEEYILPVRFDDTEIPGLNPLIACLDLRTISPRELARIIVQKLASLPAADPGGDPRGAPPLRSEKLYLSSDVLDGGVERYGWGVDEGIEKYTTWGGWLEVYLTPAERRQATLPIHKIKGDLELDGLSVAATNVSLEAHYRTPPDLLSLFHGRSDRPKHVVVQAPIPVLIAAFFQTPEWVPSGSSGGRVRFVLPVAEGDYQALEIQARLRYLDFEGSAKWRVAIEG